VDPRPAQIVELRWKRSQQDKEGKTTTETIVNVTSVT
jgi:hypothetical protein